jgi:RNA polymerase sigma factor (sigma-70 family)
MDPFRENPAFLDAFRRGDLAALDRVYRAFERPLKSFILRGFAFQSDGRQLYCRGVLARSDVEDLVQETFRRAFGPKAREAYDGVRPYKNYLFTIARNAVITDLTLKRRQVPMGEALLREPRADDRTEHGVALALRSTNLGLAEPVGSDERLEDLEVYALVRGFLETLSPEDQRFFQVRFLGQCSQELTARRLGCKRARVRKLEARLRGSFLGHVRGSGYLEAQLGPSNVRRMPAQGRARAVVEKARAIWRDHHADQVPELLDDAA